MAPPRYQPLTPGQKAVILERRNQGFTLGQISGVTFLPKSTISSFLSRVKKHNSLDNTRPPGRPRKTSIQGDRLLVRKALAHTRVPLAELHVISNSNISESTIRRRLRESKIRKWKAAKRARLKPEHVKKRLKWAKEHLNWTTTEFEKIGWSDECSVEKGADPRQVWVFRRSGNKEKFRPQNVCPKDKSGSVSLMVWGCFVGTKLCPLASFRGVNTTVTYVTGLRENLLPFLETLPPNLKHDFIFQQDNARIHTAQATQAFFAQEALKVMEWPPNSPDMNPIEHLWRVLKAALHKRYPDSRTLPGGPEAVREVLEQRLKEVWQEIGPEVLTVLINSMPSQVKELYQARGWYTHY